ncbi:MAG TPA: hypothetical protein VNR00_07120 [Opitutus sp.]|nr:hypothetical protein [Opitutus sp.]
MRRALTLFITQFLLWAVVSQVNHSLAGRHVYLWVGGLFVTYGALSLSLRSGLLSSFLAGLLLDAVSPVAFGMHALLFAAAHALVFHVRDRVPRDETAGRVVIALFANLTLFLVFSVFLIDDAPTPAAAWPRLIFDLVCSQVFLALIAPWFMALQARTVELSDALAVVYVRRFR